MTERPVYKSLLQQTAAENEQLRLEIAKLRAALEQISVNYPDPSPAGMIARAALNEETK